MLKRRAMHKQRDDDGEERRAPVRQRRSSTPVSALMSACTFGGLLEGFALAAACANIPRHFRFRRY